MATCLTKSRYMAGLQCLRRLWLLVHEPPPFEAPTPGAPPDPREQVLRAAHLLFPGGIEISEGPLEHAQALAYTAALMADPSVPAIFNAAFEHDGIRIRVDILERLAAGTWGLREVKASTGLKAHYIDGIALSTNVLRGAGLDVGSIELIHLNPAYVRGPSGIDWPKLFIRLDVGDLIEEACTDVPGHLPAMRACIGSNTLPKAEPGAQCSAPYDCQFWDRCTADKPEDWVFYLPRRSKTQAEALEALGIEAISAIPSDFPLTPRQAIIRDALVTGQPFVAPDLQSRLSRCAPPAIYLDFEAMMPPIPLYAGTKPYQTIPFQWSLHELVSYGTLRHSEFLADAAGDPRRAFAETLIEAVSGSDAPVIVYSSYEQTRLADLAGFFPDLADPLNAIIGRLVDLLPIVRTSVYFPAAGFSNSIKAVGPALCPDFTYDDLTDIADGSAASTAFVQLASEYPMQEDDINRLRAALLLYCQRDTLAMVEVHRALITAASKSSSPALLPSA